MTQRFAGIGGHHSHKSGTVEWLTPPDIIAALGPFDLDPCAPVFQPYPTAERTFTIRDNGLLQRWSGRVWVNPPYSANVIGQWLGRLAEHNHGTALIFARTETRTFFEYVWERAAALLFIRGRLTFRLPDGSLPASDEGSGNSGAPSVLCAYGATDADVLAACKIDGAFVPLRFPRSVLVSLFPTSNEEAKSVDVSWREALAEFFVGREGPVSLPELYVAFSTHPKASTNPNYAAKLRQQLQAGDYRRVDRGLWEARA